MMGEELRKLASVRRISGVYPIEGADNIEKVTVDGWDCVIKKGDFKPGDVCVYFEIDSFLPIRPEFEFLRKSCYKKLADGKEGFRLKTIKLRGTLSQGLAMPIMSLNLVPTEGSLGHSQIILRYQQIGKDLTEELGVIKYEPPIPPQLQGKVKGYFPGFLKKTDQERIQNIWHKINFSGHTFEVTVKLDGTSCTYFYRDGKFGVCSRNLELEETEGNTLWKFARKHNIEDCLRTIGRNIALQGEVIGEGIQGNPEGLIGQDFHLFDIFDIDTGLYIIPDLRRRIALYIDVKHVPIIDKNFHVRQSLGLEGIIAYADGPSLNSPVREGIVFRSNQTDLTFKVISNEFLLQEGK